MRNLLYSDLIELLRSGLLVTLILLLFYVRHTKVFNSVLVVLPENKLHKSVEVILKSTIPHKWIFNFSVKTIFAQLPRYVNKNDEYYMRRSEEARKSFTVKLYLDFIRNSKAQPPPCEQKPAYETTNGDDLLQVQKHFDRHCHKYEFGTQQNYHFITLPPEKLMKILIKPKYIALGKVIKDRNSISGVYRNLFFYVRPIRLNTVYFRES